MSSIDTITSTAASGLRASQSAIAVLSDNIANAGVAGYTAKTLDLSTFQVGGASYGVRTGLVSRSVDAAVQASVWSSASTVGALTVQSQALSAVNLTQGTPGDGTSLADAMTNLQSSFTLLQSQPSDQTQQSSVVAAANTLATTISGTAAAITQERSSVQAQIVTGVATFNTALATVQSTTRDIMAATSAGQDTASLEDSRDSALQTMSGMLNLHYDKQPNGDITILGVSGFTIPLNGRLAVDTSPIVSPAAHYAAGSSAVPPVMLVSSDPTQPAIDVTKRLSSGQLGGLIQLRDTTLPAYTATLDTLSAKLSNQFSSQGLQLFTDGSSTSPLTAYAGLSSKIQVNAAVLATPSLVRDGTGGTLNPSGASGYSSLIDQVLNVTFAASGGTSLSTDAQSFVSQQATATAQASAALTTATAYQTTVASKLSDGSGVDVDREMGLMIQLQNSYQANARVIQTSQALFTALLNATQSVS